MSQAQTDGKKAGQGTESEAGAKMRALVVTTLLIKKGARMDNGAENAHQSWPQVLGTQGASGVFRSLALCPT